MNKYYLLFLGLIVCITLSGQNKQLGVSEIAQSESQFAKLFHSQHDNKLQQSTQQKISLVQSVSNVLKQQLDSMVQPGYKSTYTYDSYGQKFIETNWYEQPNGWSERYKDSSAYNINGQLLTYIEFENDFSTNALVMYSKIEYEYNTNDNTEKRYLWNTANQSWVLRDKTVNTFDNTGEIILSLIYLWNVNSWIDDYKTVYEYDTNANKTVKTDYQWWSSEWLNSSKTTYNYDDNGNALGKTNFSWSSTTQTWTESYKEEYSLDSNFNISTIISYNWNETTELWEQFSKVECFYDLNTMARDVFSDNIINVFGKHKITSAKLYRSNDGTNWVYDGIANMYYSSHDFQSGIKTLVDDSFKVYPNPASNYIKLNMDKAIGQFTVQLIDFQGKIVLNQTTTKNNAVSIDKLSKGLYIYKILSDTKVYNGKIIVK